MRIKNTGGATSWPQSKQGTRHGCTVGGDTIQWPFKATTSCNNKNQNASQINATSNDIGINAHTYTHILVHGGCGCRSVCGRLAATCLCNSAERKRGQKPCKWNILCCMWFWVLHVAPQEIGGVIKSFAWFPYSFMHSDFVKPNFTKGGPCEIPLKNTLCKTGCKRRNCL